MKKAMGGAAMKGLRLSAALLAVALLTCVSFPSLAECLNKRMPSKDSDGLVVEHFCCYGSTEKGKTEACTVTSRGAECALYLKERNALVETEGTPSEATIETLNSLNREANEAIRSCSEGRRSADECKKLKATYWASRNSIIDEEAKSRRDEKQRLNTYINAACL
jgi:hypothetical protein